MIFKNPLYYFSKAYALSSFSVKFKILLFVNFGQVFKNTFEMNALIWNLIFYKIPLIKKLDVCTRDCEVNKLW